MPDLFVKKSNYEIGNNALQIPKVTPATFKVSQAINKKANYANYALTQL